MSEYIEFNKLKKFSNETKRYDSKINQIAIDMLEVFSSYNVKSNESEQIFNDVFDKMALILYKQK